VSLSAYFIVRAAFEDFEATAVLLVIATPGSVMGCVLRPRYQGEVRAFPERHQHVLSRRCLGGHPRGHGCTIPGMFILSRGGGIF